MDKDKALIDRLQGLAKKNEKKVNGTCVFLECSLNVH
jgi:hypothetical protein